MAIALAIAGIASAAGGFLSSSSSSKKAKEAQEEAEELQRQASGIVGARRNQDLQLPDLDLSDLRLDAEQLDVLGAVANAQTRMEFDAALSQVGQSFFPTALQASAVDTANTRAAFDDVFDVSGQLGNADARLRSEALDVFAPGSSERREATLRGLNGFLNFEIPDRLESQLQQRTAEQAFRTGQVSGPTAQRAAERLTFDELKGNFFEAAQVGQQEQALNQTQVAGAGIQEGFLPARSIDLELRNLQQRTATSLVNLENQVNQRLTNFQTDVSEAASNLARQDQLAMQQASLLLGQSNAQTQTANAFSRNASEERAAGFSALGNAIGQIDFSSLFNLGGTASPAPSAGGLN